jgi:hypothetical protein
MISCANGLCLLSIFAASCDRPCLFSGFENGGPFSLEEREVAQEDITSFITLF